MSEFVKKTVVGYREVQGNHEDPECTHVILTQKEYSELLREIHYSEYEAREAKRTMEKEIREAKRGAEYQVSLVRAETDKELAAMQKALGRANLDSDYYRGLNENLLRISRERANADRNLPRKKDHTGYVVTYSAEKECRYKINRQSWGRVLLWETVLQSPYSAEFTGEQAKKQIWEDLFTAYGDEAWKIGRLGIDEEYDGKYEDLIDEPEWVEWYATKNVLLMPEVKLRLNFNVSFWEIVIQHTQPIGVVPPDMRARQK